MLVTPVLNYFHRNSPYYEYFYRNNIKGGLNSLYNCLWYVYGALMQQGQFRHFWNFARPEIHIDNIKIPFYYISEKAPLLHCRAQDMKAANLITEIAYVTGFLNIQIFSFSKYCLGGN
jgi:hypothetical protein